MSVTTTVSQLEATHLRAPHLKGLADAQAWALAQDRIDPPGSAVQLLRQLLTRAECMACHEAALECGQRLDVIGGGPFAGGGLCDELDGTAHDVAFSDEHCALYLHYDGWLQRERPELCSKLLVVMRAQPGVPSNPAVPLQIRCAEYHSYGPGGGLLQPGHRDDGSALTMSVLVSEPNVAFGGGEFVTWSEDGRPVAHDDMRCGDAVLFHSCVAHNVAQVSHGLRQSLVIELWARDANVENRES